MVENHHIKRGCESTSHLASDIQDASSCILAQGVGSIKRTNAERPAEHPTTIITIITDRQRTSGNDTAITNDHGINNDMTSTDNNDVQRISDYQIHPEQMTEEPIFVSHKRALISEPRCSTPCDTRFSHAIQWKWPF